MTDSKKDAFLITRLTTQEKQNLQAEADKRKIKLSKLVRQMIGSFLQNKDALSKESKKESK